MPAKPNLMGINGPSIEATARASSHLPAAESSLYPGARSARPRSRWLRALLGIVLAAFTFAIGCVALRHLLPPPVLPVVTAKLDYFRAHKDEYDAIFIGSSRVVHGVVPEVFDATLAARGISCRSFNLGVERMFPPESFQMLQAVLAMKPARLKWVFVEMTPIFTTDTEPTLRSITWHNAFGTKLVVADLAARNGNRQLITRHGSVLIDNLKLWGMNAANLGRVPALLQPEPDEAKAATEFAGYMPLYGTHFENEAKSQKYERLLDAMSQKLPPPVEIASQHAFVAELGRVEKEGPEPLLFVTPLPQPSVDFLSALLAEKRLPVPVLAFNDARKFGPLFGLDHRYDGDHLNDVGARAFSALLAQSLAERSAPPAR